MVFENERLNEMLTNGHARRMGHIENYFAIMQRQKLYKSFAVIAKFNNKINDKPLLFHALRSLLLKYPILASTIVNSDYSDTTTPRPIHDYIKIIDTIRLKDLILELPQDIKNLKNEELLKELNKIELPYGDENSLWKLAFLDDYTLVYITNHCLSDGMSARYLLEDLENEFEKISITQQQFTTIELEQDYDTKLILNYNSDHYKISKLPQTLESLVSYTPPWWYIPEYLFNLFFIKKFCFASTSTVSRDQESIYKTIHLTPNQLYTIKKRLQTNESTTDGGKITITPFIQASWLNAQYKSGMLNNSYLKLSDISIPCNARQYLPSGIDQDQFKYGVNTSGSHKFFYPVKRLTWSIINYFNNYAKFIFQTKRYLFNIGILTLEKISKRQNLDKMVLENALTSKRGNTVFSNIGLVHDSMNKNYRIQDIQFAQPAGCLIFGFSMCTVASVDGGMNLVISMIKDVVEPKMFDNMIEIFKENLSSDDIEVN